MEKGQLVHVLRSVLGDCTGGGVSGKNDRFILVGEGLDGIFEVDDDTPALKLVVRWRGTDNEYIHCEPVGERPEGSVGPMFGGNYVSSSDSRVRDVCKYPIPVHDRFETQEQYDSNWI